MTISFNLYNAIFAMDAYNRDENGVGPGLELDNQVALGEASLLEVEGPPDDPEFLNAQAAGFFAVAYELTYEENGADVTKKIISFRGTDFGTGNWIDLALDVAGGWIAGAGVTELPVEDADVQTAHAEAFFTQVTGRSIFDDPAGDVILTGHSLGGGLAGFISAISGEEAAIFDHMPYMRAAVTRYVEHIAAVSGLEILDFFENLITFQEPITELPENLVPFSSQIKFPPPTAENVTGYRIDGEILTSVANPLAVPIMFTLLSGIFNPVVAGLYEGYAAVFGSLQEDNPFDADNNRGAVDLHSQPLLITQMFADENGNVDWEAISADLIDSFFSQEIAEAAGFGALQGYFDDKNKMQSAIAYTVLDEGERPFGDDAIRAWCNDADELGRAVSETNGAIQDWLPALTGIVTQGELTVPSFDFPANDNIPSCKACVVLVVGVAA